MVNLASSKEFLAASNASSFFAKYGAKPGGPVKSPAALGNGGANADKPTAANKAPNDEDNTTQANKPEAAATNTNAMPPAQAPVNPTEKASADTGAMPPAPAPANPPEETTTDTKAKQFPQFPVAATDTTATTNTKPATPETPKVANSKPASRLAAPAQGPVSAAEKMSAFTQASKQEAAVDDTIPDLKRQVDDLTAQLKNTVGVIEVAQAAQAAQVAEAAKAAAATAKPTTPPITSGEVSASTGKAKTTLKSHLSISPPPTVNLPPYITTLKPFTPTTLASKPVPLPESIRFPHSFLLRTLGGGEFNAGLHFPAHSLTELLTEHAAARVKRLKKMESGKACTRAEKEVYFLLDAGVNPYVPVKPGTHGASLTPILRDFESDGVSEKVLQGRYVDFPVFVAVPSTPEEGDTTEGEEPARKSHATPAEQAKAKGKEVEREYIYMGQYTQRRWSDRLSVTESTSLVPPHVLTHWASILTFPTRPAWMTSALLPLLETPPEPGLKPDMRGPPLEAALLHYFEELGLWRQDAEMALANLDEADLKKRFGEPDAGERPAWRWWWEYLVCEGFDRGFYQRLGSLLRGEQGKSGSVEEGKGGGKGVEVGGGGKGKETGSVFGIDGAGGSKFEKVGFAGLDQGKEGGEGEGGKGGC